MNQAKTDNFLEQLIALKKPVMIFLVNGVKLQGTIEEIRPNGNILLERHGNRQVIYLHAISTIMETATSKPDPT